ncbi:aldose 1-epimerase family protein [Paenibacillus sp. MBLB4367]|uniref:aldose 1-epimerase family protein n=1 Tax=Paenibacillus sp. MBLB4367 TaxID=3384767 RepID=UPI0039082E45
MELFGRQWTRRELEARVGRLEQIGDLQRLKRLEGMEADVELIHVRTGAGLSYYVNPMKGLDISLAEFAGVPISWQAANGDVHPAYYDDRGAEWLRTASGGLLMTCGLTQAGAPSEEGGEKLGLHGRAHHSPAKQVSARGEWAGDEYEMRVTGTVEEASTAGSHLRLTREISSKLGDNRIRIRDVVENAGFTAAPHMMMYHFNFGYPLLAEETTIELPSDGYTMRDADARAESYGTWQAPDPAAPEAVLFHRVVRGSRVTAAIRNPRFPLANGSASLPLEARLSWHTANLPQLVQWHMPGAGMHVLGIEPANCLTFGRAAERAAGRLVTLEPGEAVTYELELEVRVLPVI